jgi:glyoxylase-like metal-dependent hydrolase (beta-lactamase superfamily II)
MNKMKITKISNRNIIFTTKENSDWDLNLGLILGKKHNFIVDTGMGASNVKAMLDYLGDDSKPIIAINTHAHVDHIMGNWALESSQIVSHILCHEIMNKEWDKSQWDYIENNREYFDKEIIKCLPNVVFEGSMHFPEDGISLFHTPGHTEDSISVFDSSDKVLYIGDNFGVAKEKALIWTENLDQAKNLIETYKEYEFEICVPSHCQPQSREIISLLEKALAETLK